MFFIHINMKYLVSKFPCTIVGRESRRLCENVKYGLKNVDDHFYMIFGDNGELPICINFDSPQNSNAQRGVLQFDYLSDNYTILFPQKVLPTSVNILKVLNREIIITLSQELSIFVDSENLIKKSVSKLEFSHSETRADYCLLYFDGVRNFVVILKGKELCCADYYDEINIGDDEIYFMKRLKDSLNHGKVYLIKDKKFDSYLIYLDEEDMHLCSQLVMVVFLDALVAGNFEYCNQMLAEDIHQEDAINIQKFFPEFDDYQAIDSYNVALLRKNTLAGIFEFKIADNKIENIIER